MSRLLQRAGATAHDVHEIDLTPEGAGWTWSGLQVLALPAGTEHRLDLAEQEAVVLPLSGAVEVLHDGATTRLQGRADVFEGPAGATLLPRGTDAAIRTEHRARVAVATARTDVVCEAATIGASDVVVEIRGAGDATRVVRRYALGGPLLPHRLLVVEVLTPSGNWSSYPPHKHDVHADDERELEEIYYFRARSRDGGAGHGYHRQDAADADGGELLARVVDGDVALVPDGYHGPCMAPPGHDLYYLNVMAGPVADGSWLTSDDPALAWVRRSWEHEAPDERIGPGGELA